MEGHLEAGLTGLAENPPQVPVLPEQEPVAARGVGVGLAEGRAAAPQGPVGEELETRHPEAMARVRHDTHRFAGLDPVEPLDGDGKPILVVERLQDRHLGVVEPHVGGAREAALAQVLEPGQEASLERTRPGSRDVRRHRLHGRIDEDARQPAPLSHEDAARRVGDVLPHARRAEGRGAGPGRVAVHTSQEDRPLGEELVERGAVRITAAPEVLVPAETLEPVAVGEAFSRLRGDGEGPLFGGAAPQVGLFEEGAQGSHVPVVVPQRRQVEPGSGGAPSGAPSDGFEPHPRRPQEPLQTLLLTIGRPGSRAEVTACPAPP